MQELHAPPGRVEDLVFDVGMNNGDDTAYYLHLGLRVVAVEANPVLAARAAKRFDGELKRGRLKILEVAVAESRGELDFWVAEDASVLGSCNKDSAAQFGSPLRAIRVPCRTFRSILETEGTPYFLKIDIEGSDNLCIEGLAADSLPRYISVEADSGLDTLAKLKALGYSRFKCISQFYFLPVELAPAGRAVASPLRSWLNLPARAADRLLGRRLLTNRVMPSCWKGAWFFPYGSSGPFGEDSLGRWQGFDEICATYSHFKRLFDLGRPSPYWRQDRYRSFWADFHACLDD